MMQELYFEEKIGDKSFFNLVLYVNSMGIYTTSPDSPERRWHSDHIYTRSDLVVWVAQELVRLNYKQIEGDEYFGYRTTLGRLNDMLEVLYGWEESKIGVVPKDIVIDAIALCKKGI